MIFKYHHSLSDVSQSSFQVSFSLAWKPEPTGVWTKLRKHLGSSEFCQPNSTTFSFGLEVTCRHELYAIYMPFIMFGFLSNGNIYPKTMEKKPVQACFQAPWACSYHVQSSFWATTDPLLTAQPWGWLMPSSRLRGNGWGWGSPGRSQVVPHEIGRSFGGIFKRTYRYTGLDMSIYVMCFMCFMCFVLVMVVDSPGRDEHSLRRCQDPITHTGETPWRDEHASANLPQKIWPGWLKGGNDPTKRWAAWNW